MKRSISFICCIMLVLSCISFAPRANASEAEQSNAQVLINQTVEHLEDGSMIITSVYEDVVSSRSNLYNKSGHKERAYRDAKGNILWTLTVYGEFRIIEGASVTCISAACSSEIYDPNWSCTRKSAAPSGNQAVANGVFEMIVLGIAISRQEVNVTLSCDPYGNLY